MTLFRRGALLLWVTCLFALCRLSGQTPEFMSLAAARPALEAMRGSLPAGLRSATPLSAAAWDRWVRARDREIRGRVAQGEDLTLVNLLRLGIAYTREPRITYAPLDRYGRDPLVNATAERRAGDLIRALTAPGNNEGMLQMRALLQERGFSLITAAERDKVKAYLLDSLARQRDEVARGRVRAAIDHSQVFSDRGLSTDSDIYTGYAIELHLRNLARRGVLKPGGVRRVAIIGPGLDFVNKKFGYDFYPPQTIQPFAVIDSLLRLGLAERDRIEVRTFDVSPRVNRHIERARAGAASGRPYTLQLLWNRTLGGSDGFLSDFRSYWRRMGTLIGTSVAPIAVPAAARADVASRAVSIPPEVVARIVPADLNVIVQRERLAENERFDLVIGTNIFLYYDGLEQSLAGTNLAQMMASGGLLISNTALTQQAPSKLADSARTDIPLGRGLTDSVFSYRRR
jgi:hypothetical protein